LILEIDGETIVRIMPDIGYLHTGIEKTCEAKFYQQVVPLTDRIDYLCPLTNNLCYVLAVEKLLGLDIPPKAQWMRVMLNELTRINSHLVWLGTHALDIGAMSVFLYCFREREDILRLFEMVSGQRMMTSYFRIGGLALEPPLGFFERVREFANRFPAKAASISICDATCPTPAMKTFDSKCPSHRMAMCSLDIFVVSARCGNQLRSCSRRSTVCPKAELRRTLPKSYCPTAKK